MSPLRIASLAIGDELLDGRVLDGNSRDLGDALSVLGNELSEARVVPDDRARIMRALAELAALHDIIVTSGGLGPTSDDITGECIAAAAGVGLRFDAPSFERMEAMFAARGMPMPPSNRRQAELPATSRTLENQMGTAPGFVTPLPAAGRVCQVWSFPGVPREYRHLLEEYMLPELRAAGVPGAGLVRRTARSLGLAESAIGERLQALEQANPDVRVQYRAAFPEIIVRLVLNDDDGAATQARADALLQRACAEIGDSVWGVGDEPLEVRVLQRLLQERQTVSVAESCTGGWVQKRLTDVPGSSAAFLGGVVSYADDAKGALLGVPAAVLAEHGAVSEQAARAMAEGVRAQLSSTWSVSVTGIAGPGGGSADKPVGTVWYAVCGPEGTVARKKRLPDFGRERVREMATAWALRLLWESLLGQAIGRTP